jgi:fructose/tagatose bisphosphate aldolase
MTVKSLNDLVNTQKNAVSLEGDTVQVIDERRLRESIDILVYNAVFADGLVRDTARWWIWEIGQELGIYPASIHELYMAAGKGQLPHPMTVPAINVRAMNFNTSRAVFRAAKKLDVGSLIFEIARSEMGYTDQRPAEYVSSVMGAAIKEGYRGPLFIQGDHFQVSAKSFASDPDRELSALRDLIAESIEAGFYNIDIDTSTLVDLNYESLDMQQERNFKICSELTKFVRDCEPEQITISLGGEIGEVGGHNSTVPELRAFMTGFIDEIGDVTGISKISVQTGTSHGGVVLPDGTLAQVSVDFDTLGELSRISREEYGLGGAVQHGASTLPPSAFNKFPEVDTVEIHLATNFQNIIYENLPGDLVQSAYDYVITNHKGEWKEGKTEEQFIYSIRKKAVGPFKQDWWDVDLSIREKLGQVLQEQFEFLFEKLNVKNTREFTNQVTPLIEQHRLRPISAVEEGDLEIAADLAD